MQKEKMGKNLSKIGLINSLAFGIKMLAMLAANKIIAIYTGPIGYATIGNFQNFYQVIAAISTGAINNGVIRYTSEKINNEAYLSRLWKTSITIGLVSSSFAALTILVFKKEISKYILEGIDGEIYIIITAITVFLIGINLILLSIINGLKKYWSYAIANILGSIIFILLLSVFAVFEGLEGALLALSLHQGLMLFTTLVVICKIKELKFSDFFGCIDRNIAKKLLKYSIMGIVTAATVPLSLLIVRDLITLKLGAEYAGIWEAMWRLSAAQITFYTSIIGIYLLPKYSELDGSTAIKNEIKSTLSKVTPIVAATSLIIFVFKDAIIIILFSEKFLQMKYYLDIQLLGDFFKVIGWIMGYVLIAKGLMRTYLFTTIYFPFQFIVLTYILLPFFGVKGVAISHLLNYIIFDIFLVYYLYRKLS